MQIFQQNYEYGIKIFFYSKIFDMQLCFFFLIFIYTIYHLNFKWYVINANF